jgi:D-aminoacyl-tRNA deacylase
MAQTNRCKGRSSAATEDYIRIPFASYLLAWPGVKPAAVFFAIFADFLCQLCVKGLYWQTALMRAVVQRVSRAQVTVGGEITGRIDRGLLVLLGVSGEDTEADADYLAEKIAGLRIFEDHDGKMNRAAREAGGSLLVVSQFTLYGDARRGKRPSFDAAARPEQARRLYEYFVERIRAAGLRCETGQFQEMMQVELVNDGPVTILLDSGKAF